MDGLADGRVDPVFQTVRDVFEASFTDRQNVGAAVAVFVDGRAVVDLWGGVADSRTGRPWDGRARGGRRGRQGMAGAGDDLVAGVRRRR